MDPAMGLEIGKSLVELDRVPLAKELMEKYGDKLSAQQKGRSRRRLKR